MTLSEVVANFVWRQCLHSLYNRRFKIELGVTLKQLLDGFSDRLRVSDEVGQCVDKRRAAKWFFGLTLPYVLSASATIALRESFQPNPGNVELAIRMLLVGLGFTVIFVLFYRAIVMPAVLEYEDSQRSERESQDEQDCR